MEGIWKEAVIPGLRKATESSVRIFGAPANI
jgi:hypothetical protein